MSLNFKLNLKLIKQKQKVTVQVKIRILNIEQIFIQFVKITQTFF